MLDKEKVLESVKKCMDHKCDDCVYEYTGCNLALYDDLRAVMDRNDIADTVEILTRHGKIVTVTKDGNTMTIKVEEGKTNA